MRHRKRRRPVLLAELEQTMRADLTYITKGLFTTIYPETEAGRVAWGQINEQTPGAKIYTSHLDVLLSDLRAAGYSVRKQTRRLLADDAL